MESPGFFVCVLSLIFATLSKIFSDVICELQPSLYITGMNFLKPIICVLLALSLVGCAVSKNPNPMIRYGANAGATMALPGLAGAAVVAVVAGAADEDDKDKSYMSDSEKQRQKERDDAFFAAFGVSLAVAGVGCLVGGLIGGTVGFIKWMINGFEDDHDAAYSDLPEDILPPTK
ncbi:hypothetical protein SAMN05720758_2318 [Fibrobacter sp. UWB11]|nr:hypothetical protein SAMN05720758_2318 [Fibrobacter sp. UWB11]